MQAEYDTELFCLLESNSVLFFFKMQQGGVFKSCENWAVFSLTSENVFAV